MASKKFEERLHESLNAPTPPPPVKVRRRRFVGFNHTHVFAGVVVAVVLGIGGYAFHGWLDGRSVGEGVEAVMEKSEAANHDNKASEDDLGPAPVYVNCEAVREIYPAGVAQIDNPRVYDANRVLDTNHNRYVCEDNER